MAPTQSAPAAPKLPTSTDHNVFMNKFSLASSKRPSFLTSMRAKLTANAQSSLATEIANGAFSSLQAASDPQPAASLPSQRARPATDDSDLRFENPNAGIGHEAPKSEERTSAATRDLSRRLLGKRGRRDEDLVAAQKLRRAAREQESEEEEEEGRSGLGRRKKKRARVEEDEPTAGDIEMREGCHAPASALAVEAEPLPAEITNEDAAKPKEGLVESEVGDAQKKKKKKRRRKNEKNKADGTGDA